LEAEHRRFISSLIRAHLDEIDASAGDDAAREIREDSSSHSSQSVAQGPEFRGKTVVHGHITLRSRQSPVSFASMGDSFRTRLSVWLAKALADLDIRLPCSVKFCPGDLVSNVHTRYHLSFDAV
jgi:hypothetical protein